MVFYEAEISKSAKGDLKLASNETKSSFRVVSYVVSHSLAN